MHESQFLLDSQSSKSVTLGRYASDGTTIPFLVGMHGNGLSIVTTDALSFERRFIHILARTDKIRSAKADDSVILVSGSSRRLVEVR